MKSRSIQYFRIILWIGVYSLIITILVSTGLRLNMLSDFRATHNWPSTSSIDYKYARYPIMTLAHIIPGALFIIAGLFQFNRTFRNKHPGVHKRIGKFYLLLGCIVGITALIMGITFQFGGIVETIAVTLFGLFFLYSLINAYYYAKKKNFMMHREWMIRGYSLGLAVATMRPIIGLFFALTDIAFSNFFGYVFWLAFIPHILVAEWWIRYTRKDRKQSLQNKRAT